MTLVRFRRKRGEWAYSISENLYCNQLLVLAVACYLFFSAGTPQETELLIPFFKNLSLPLGALTFISLKLL